MKYTIRKVEKGTELSKRFREYVAAFSWKEVKEHLLWMIDNRVFHDWEAFFVLMDGERIVGMASIAREDYYPLPEIFPWISSVFISESHRGQGLSGVLIRHLNDYAKTLGFPRTYIPSIHTGLYEKFGYAYVRDIVNYAGGVDRLYVKELEEPKP